MNKMDKGASSYILGRRGSLKNHMIIKLYSALEGDK